MEIGDAIRCEGPQQDVGQIPSENQDDLQFVLNILAAEDSPQTRTENQRRWKRQQYHATVSLELNYQQGQANLEGKMLSLHARDISSNGMGFVTRESIPVASDALVYLTLPDGKIRHVGCWVLRCREVVGGWYEGAVLFDRAQPEFSSEPFIPNSSCLA